MNSTPHAYSVGLRWTGNRGSGTSRYHAYSRDHVIQVEGKPDLLGSSDPAFRGDRTRYNPEELLVASLAACHMLWYLHLCAEQGIVVSSYEDRAEGRIALNEDGSGRFTEVVLRPRVKVASGDRGMAAELHGEAQRMCFIAQSVNFLVRHEPVFEPVNA